MRRQQAKLGQDTLSVPTTKYGRQIASL